ncbi:hypothetical protein OUZ56_011588 [Daphnia magna]|uniref:Uncharacterized protein n=1 Tax=Daphnia magna TaxID=35525 RepID=A0ABQ9Z0J1_9CRUS|nr:hypothetical protein OUZ56_011588 [Daphnia magna]
MRASGLMTDGTSSNSESCAALLEGETNERKLFDKRIYEPRNENREGRRGDGHIGQGWLPVHNVVNTDGIFEEALIATP